MSRFPTRSLFLCLALLAGPALAQDAAPALPAWDQLTPAQREALIAPMRERWNDEPESRAHMLRRAERWRDMSPEERQRAHRGMKRWEDMSPERRQETRALFEHMRRLPEAEQQALRERWRAMSPAERERWLREHRPRD
ncbi:DUF3106 domain-containing protein [Luteimonas sp. Y-2-2-4F]|nr:DUF3106 domain-containing protein [Luteimonas sp. Y-2-2-4F]MCD9033679.1 DUF3106 domain-containing protein [Luteimonas sp. Y-2-2-4F]